MNKKVLAIASIAVFVLYVTSIFYSSYIVLSFNDKNLAATSQEPLKNYFGGSSSNNSNVNSDVIIATDQTKINDIESDNSSENRTTFITTTTTTMTGFHSRVNSVELFDLENIPTFMKDYFEWHGRQLQIMKEDARKSETDGNNDSEENDDYLANHRFLVLRCAGGKNNRNEYIIDRCGGLSDRLKPLPLFLWYAATTNRILFIRWDRNRPAPIETFMMPGNSWNWTIPDALLRKIDKLEENIGIDNNNGGGENFTRLYFDGLGVHQMLRKIGDHAVWMIEGNDYSGGYTRYAKFVNAAIKMSSSASVSDAISALKLRPGDAHYENFYHDLFHITFRPSSGVQTLLSAYFYDPKTNENIEREKINEDTGDGVSSMSKSWLPVPLQRNRYAVAHFRAKYPGEPYRETQNRTILREITIHAVECAKSRASGTRLLKNPRNTSSSTTLAKGVSAVYFASDTALAVEAARDSYHNHDAGQFEAGVDPKNTINVWTYLDLQSYDTDNDSSDRDGSSMKTKHTITLAEDPPHLNFAKRDDLSAFNVIFVDMFLMSYASCVVYAAGGFGRMGSLVSYRPSCGMPYTANRGILKHCDPYD